MLERRQTRRRSAASATSRRCAARARRKGGVLEAEELLGLGATLAALRETRAASARRAAELRRGSRDLAAARAASDRARARDRALPRARGRGARRRRRPRWRGRAPRAPRARRARSSSALERLLRDPDVARASLGRTTSPCATTATCCRCAPTRAARRARHRARRLALGDHALRRARGAGRAQQPATSRPSSTRSARRCACCASSRRRRAPRRTRSRPGLERWRRSTSRLRAPRSRSELRATRARGRTRGHRARLRSCAIRCFRRTRPSPNDLRLGEGYQVLVLSGPNAGGKTVAMKSVALAVLCVRAGLHVPAGRGARVDFFDARARRHRRRAEHPREPLDLLRAHGEPRAHRRGGDPALAGRARRDRHGTDPSEGAALAQAVLEALADRGARVIATTHYGLLKEMAEVDSALRERERRVRSRDARADLSPARRHPGRLVGARGRRAHGPAPRRARRAPTSCSSARTASSTACSRSWRRAAPRSSSEQQRGGARARGERGGARRVRGEALGSSSSAATSSTARCARISSAASATRTRRSPP